MFKPEMYHKNNHNQRKGSLKVMEMFQDQLQETFGTHQVSLIDIGTGCGTTLSDILGKTNLNISKVVGVDVSTEMNEFARKNNKNEAVSFEVWSFNDEAPEKYKMQFDLCTSFFALMFAIDMRKTFESVAKFLKPSGIFVGNCVLETNLLPTIDFLGEMYPQCMKNWRSFFTSLWSVENPYAELEIYLEQAGFKTIKVIPTEFEFKYNTIEELSAFWRTSEPFSKFLEKDLQEQYFEDFKKCYLALHPDGKNDFSLRGKFVIFFAQMPESDE